MSGAVYIGWHARQIEDARRLWLRIWLVTGGTHGSMRQTCRAARLGTCPDMRCQCRHWFNIPHRKRAMLIGIRAGMPYGLIALCAGDLPHRVAAQVDLYARLCETVPALMAQAERVTALVPMWSDRIRGELAGGILNADCL